MVTFLLQSAPVVTPAKLKDRRKAKDRWKRVMRKLQFVVHRRRLRRPSFHAHTVNGVVIFSTPPTAPDSEDETHENASKKYPFRTSGYAAGGSDTENTLSPNSGKSLTEPKPARESASAPVGFRSRSLSPKLPDLQDSAIDQPAVYERKYSK